MSKLPGVRGFVEIEYYNREDTPGIDVPFHKETEELVDIENLVVNLFREWLPRLIAPRIITGRVDNSESDTTWRDRRVCLIGFGAGDEGSPTPSVKPEDPEDGRTLLVGEASYPNSKLGLQGPMRRIPLNPTGPSEVNRPVGFGDPTNEDIDGLFLLKEVDPDGISMVQVALGGSEISFTYTVEEDEYVGNIMEYGLYLGGGDAADDTQFDIGGGNLERRRLSRNNAVLIARKTRNLPIEKTRDFKFRAIWRLRA